MAEHALPDEEQRRRLCELMHHAFVALRALCDENKSKQAGKLADIFHNLPTEMYGVGLWDPAQLRRALQSYRQEYGAGYPSFVDKLDDIFDLDPNDFPDHIPNLTLDDLIADYSEHIRNDPDDFGAYRCRADLLTKRGDYAGAIADLEQAIRVAPEVSSAYYSLAWLLVKSPKEELRDGPRAVELATKHWELEKRSDMSSAELLAAASAEAGDFQKAVEWQTKAISLIPDDLQEVVLTIQLQRYHDGGKYVDPDWEGIIRKDLESSG